MSLFTSTSAAEPGADGGSVKRDPPYKAEQAVLEIRAATQKTQAKKTRQSAGSKTVISLMRR
ncbi:hypothetical protein ACFW0H_25265 [Pseudomonas sp. CR3202]|uniref:hypothetical protein n=1 Tax=Pseudomonas sp. CR3202 TaxID=3351532 RepID=UPI003BEFD35C